MTTLLFTHPAALAHDMGPGHPERPDRYRAITKALGHERFAALDRREAPIVERASVQRVHLLAFCPQSHDLVADLHNVRETHLIQSLGQPNPALSGRCHSISFRRGTFSPA